MGCFVVPVSEAIVVSVVKHAVKKLECKNNSENTIKFSTKLGWLSKMLWGGSALLIFEHLWHGELTTMFSGAGISGLLHEIATAGVTMSLLVTSVWAVMVGVSFIVERNIKRNIVENKK